MKKSRILVIENSIAVTGALNSILRSSAGLSDRFEFIFLLPTESAAFHYVRDHGFQTLAIPLREIRKDPVALFTYMPSLLANTFRLQRLIAQHKIDLLVVNDFYNLLPCIYRLLGGKIKHLCYVRFLPSKFPSVLVNLWSGLHRRTAYATIAVSQAVSNELPQSNAVIIGNELPFDEGPYIPPTSRVLLYPANYIPGKGHEYALTSFAAVAKRHPDWTLRFVGGDMGLEKNRMFKNSLMSMATKLDIQQQVQWENFADNISQEYINAGIVLNFSESESFSMTCLEAMYYGRPVIATRCGGPSEIIDHEETGLLIDVADTSAMSVAIDHMISNPVKREEMAQLSYERVRKKFSFENTIGNLGKLYQQALNE